LSKVIGKGPDGVSFILHLPQQGGDALAADGESDDECDVDELCRGCDISGDGQYTPMDALICIGCINGTITGAACSTCDTDESGALDAGDVLKIVKCINAMARKSPALKKEMPRAKGPQSSPAKGRAGRAAEHRQSNEAVEAGEIEMRALADVVGEYLGVEIKVRRRRQGSSSERRKHRPAAKK
jgi:hypothetical protein